MSKYYKIKSLLSVEGEANEKYSQLSLSELNHAGCRTIGGDKGDIVFTGFYVENGFTFLDDAELRTSLDGLTDTEVCDIANEILRDAFDSIGIEVVY